MTSGIWLNIIQSSHSSCTSGSTLHVTLYNTRFIRAKVCSSFLHTKLKQFETLVSIPGGVYSKPNFLNHHFFDLVLTQRHQRCIQDFYTFIRRFDGLPLCFSLPQSLIALCACTDRLRRTNENSHFFLSLLCIPKSNCVLNKSLPRFPICSGFNWIPWKS